MKKAHNLEMIKNWWTNGKLRTAVHFFFVVVQISCTYMCVHIFQYSYRLNEGQKKVGRGTHSKTSIVQTRPGSNWMKLIAVDDCYVWTLAISTDKTKKKKKKTNRWEKMGNSKYLYTNELMIAVRSFILSGFFSALFSPLHSVQRNELCINI